MGGRQRPSVAYRAELTFGWLGRTRRTKSEASLAAGLALWYPLDTGRSLYHRVYANAVVNTALLVVLVIPLIGTFSKFH